MLRLTDDQIQAAVYAVSDLVARRRLEGRSIPREVLNLHRTLLIASVCGTEICAEETELVDDLIDSSEAAQILGCTPRWVRTIRADLDGTKAAGRWVFSRAAVIAYAEGRGCDSDSVARAGG